MPLFITFLLYSIGGSEDSFFFLILSKVRFPKRISAKVPEVEPDPPLTMISGTIFCPDSPKA